MIGYLFSYFVIVLLSYLYCKKDSKIPKNIKYIIVLSAAVKFVTRQRVKRAIELKNTTYNKATILASGKFHAKYMSELLSNSGVSNYIIQNKSTNTYEDAVYSKEFIPAKNIGFLLVTGPTHQRRAYNTFKKIFDCNIWNSPPNPFLSYDSVLLPLGWVLSLIEIYKNWKYK